MNSMQLNGDCKKHSMFSTSDLSPSVSTSSQTIDQGFCRDACYSGISEMHMLTVNSSIFISLWNTDFFFSNSFLKLKYCKGWNMIQTQHLILRPKNPDQYDKSGTVHFKPKKCPLYHSVKVSSFQEKQQMPSHYKFLLLTSYVCNNLCTKVLFLLK